MTARIEISLPTLSPDTAFSMGCLANSLLYVLREHNKKFNAHISWIWYKNFELVLTDNKQVIRLINEEETELYKKEREDLNNVMLKGDIANVNMEDIYDSILNKQNFLVASLQKKDLNQYVLENWIIKNRNFYNYDFV